MQNIRKRTTGRLNGSRKSRLAVARSGRRGGQLISHPPLINSYGITRDARLRFVNVGTAWTGAMTYADLLDTLLVATSSTTLYDLYMGVKINSVEAWYLPAGGSTATPGTISVVFDGVTLGAQGDQKIHTDTSMGVEPAHVKAAPAPMSQQAQWQTSSTSGAFFLQCPIGTVIDVSCSFRNPVVGVFKQAQLPGVGLSTGAIYYRGLDAVAISTSTLQPVGALSVA